MTTGRINQVTKKNSVLHRFRCLPNECAVIANCYVDRSIARIISIHELKLKKNWLKTDRNTDLNYDKLVKYTQNTT
jgi:hypothetical protein